MPQLPLFVYGTLRDPDVLAAVLGRTRIVAVPATLARYRTAVYPERTYPGLAPALGASAAGLLLTGIGELDLALLDAFEADEYRRAAVTVATADGDRAAEVYLPVVAIGPDARDWRNGRRATRPPCWPTCVAPRSQIR